MSVRVVHVASLLSLICTAFNLTGALRLSSHWNIDIEGSCHIETALRTFILAFIASVKNNLDLA